MIYILEHYLKGEKQENKFLAENTLKKAITKASKTYEGVFKLIGIEVDDAEIHDGIVFQEGDQTNLIEYAAKFINFTSSSPTLYFDLENDLGDLSDYLGEVLLQDPKDLREELEHHFLILEEFEKLTKVQQESLPMWFLKTIRKE